MSKEMKNKIALIFPYFGQWPDWIELYLKSCSLNTFIDFIFFTDCVRPKQIYSNTYFYYVSWMDYQKLISEKLGINYQRENAYALCDVKPFYGFIHKEILDKYDFWGFGDLDVCYGRLCNFIDDNILQNKDVISMHADRISGHFSLFRNSEYFRNLCFSLPDWEKKLESTEMFGLDEHFFTDLVCPGMKYVHRVYRYLFSKWRMDYRLGYRICILPVNLFTRLLFKERYTSPAPKIGEEWRYDISNGTLFDPNGRELPYLHFLFFKKTPFYRTEYYWKQDFYNISEEQIQKCHGLILFDVTGIRYKND